MVHWFRSARPAVSLILVLLASCGVGDAEESTFVLAPMSSVTGGTVDVGDIELVIPPGALAADTAIGILPEANPIPIVAAPDDPASYTHLGPQWCCGPAGLTLLVGGRLAVDYDPSTLPPGVDAEDLVLLLWDPTLQALVPVLDDDVHDLAANRFEVDDYVLLGHVALGIRDVPLAGIAFLDAVGLYVVVEDGSADPLALPTNDVRPDRFIPAPGGERVLFEFYDDSGEGQFGGLELWAVGLQDAAAVPLAGPNEDVASVDPTHGWLRDGQRVFFQDYDEGHYFSAVDGAGGEPPVQLHALGDFAYVQDVRQAPDGGALLIVYYGPQENLLLDVIDPATGAVFSTGEIPFGGGLASPRFLPDSSGLYLVRDGGLGVDRYDLDGDGPTPLFDLSREEGVLKDFVLAPGGDDYAYVAYGPQATDELHVGSLSGGGRAMNDLGGAFFYEEMIFHPSGEHVFLDGYFSGLQMFAAADAADGPELPIQRISKLDISSQDGRLLLVVEALQTSPTAEIAYPSGLYVAESDGMDIRSVPLPSGFQVAEGRWLRTIRTAPCQGFTNLVR